MDAQKAKIIEAAIGLFQEYGVKFTMDQLARSLKMSKKTLYVVLKDKMTLYHEAVDYLFDSIKTSEQQVLQDPDLDPAERIRRLLGAMPERYRSLDFQKLYILRDKYPEIYRHLTERLENDWEETIRLLEEGMESGVLRRFSIPVFKTMMESSLERFFQQDVLVQNGITYQEALDQVVGILVDGIRSEADHHKEEIGAGRCSEGNRMTGQ
jgi:AcrR family transcriptional regulator